MKTTYLIYKQVEGTRQLVAATQDEWNAILKENRGIPMENRRLFEKSCFEDGAELDCMYIEVSYVEYKKWHSADEVAGRKRKANRAYPRISLDGPVTDSELDSMHETIPSSFNLEQIAIDRVLLEELQNALRAWKPWGMELLAFYLEGKGRSCTAELCEKYGLKERAVRYRKEQFEKFVKNS